MIKFHLHTLSRLGLKAFVVWSFLFAIGAGVILSHASAYTNLIEVVDLQDNSEEENRESSENKDELDELMIFLPDHNALSFDPINRLVSECVSQYSFLGLSVPSPPPEKV